MAISIKPINSKANNTEGLTGQYKGLGEDNAYSKMQYTNGWWDYIGDLLGFRTKQDQFRDQIYNDQLLYQQQLREAQREEEYNSAEQQAQRMRAAGLNPDLTGGVEAGEATEVDNQANSSPAQPEAKEGNEAIMQISKIALDATGTLIGMFNAGLDALNAWNEFRKTEDLIGQNALNTAKEWWETGVDDKGGIDLPWLGYIGPYRQGDDGQGNEKLGSFYDYFYFMDNPYINSIARTQREKTRIYSELERHWKGWVPNLPAKEKETRAKEQEARQYSAEETIGKIQAYGENRTEIKEFFKMLYKAQKDVENAKLKAQKDYWDAFNKKDGNTGITGGEAQGEEARTQALMDKAIVEIQMSLTNQQSQLIDKCIDKMEKSKTILEKEFWLKMSGTMMNALNNAKTGNTDMLRDATNKIGSDIDRRTKILKALGGIGAF